MNTQTVQEQSSELADMMEERVDIKRSPMMDYHDAVSYTHLTLPTSDLV